MKAIKLAALCAVATFVLSFSACTKKAEEAPAAAPAAEAPAAAAPAAEAPAAAPAAEASPAAAAH